MIDISKLRPIRDFQPEQFNAYEYLERIAGETTGERVMLTNEYRSSDIGTMIKTALIAIELLAEKINAKGDK